MELHFGILETDRGGFGAGRGGGGGFGSGERGGRGDFGASRGGGFGRPQQGKTKWFCKIYVVKFIQVSAIWGMKLGRMDEFDCLVQFL